LKRCPEFTREQCEGFQRVPLWDLTHYHPSQPSLCTQEARRAEAADSRLSAELRTLNQKVDEERSTIQSQLAAVNLVVDSTGAELAVAARSAEDRASAAAAAAAAVSTRVQAVEQANVATEKQLVRGSIQLRVWPFGTPRT